MLAYFESKEGDIMGALTVRDVDFNGTMLRAAQDAENIIWVGVRWVCQGLGLSDGQARRERKRIHEDLTLNQGESNLTLPTEGGNQDILCIRLEFLPLWIAKINPTPTMQRENPSLVKNLITYQLKAKDVLAAAFLNKNTLAVRDDYSKQIADLRNTIEAMRMEQQKMYRDMSTLANIILDWKDISEKSGSVKKSYPAVSTHPSWKEEMYSKMDRICANTSKFGKRSDIMRWIYKYMTKNYGVVWDQEVKEYKDRNNTFMMPSTIDVVMDKPMIKSIFESVLVDLEYEYCHKNIIKAAGDLESNWSDLIIAPLVEKYNDHSNAAMATYRKVYKRMDEISKIGWKNLTTRFINEHGRKPSKKDLIETRPSLRKKFEIAVKELIEE